MPAFGASTNWEMIQIPLFWILTPDFCILFLFIHFDSHIRADSPAQGATGAFPGIVKEDEVTAFFVKLLGKPDHFLGTGFNAQLAAFATFFIDQDLSHFSLSIAEPIPSVFLLAYGDFRPSA